MKSFTVVASERNITCVKFNREGDLLFTAGADGLLVVWRTEDATRLGTYHYIEDKPRDFTGAELLHDIERKVQKAISHLDVTLDSKWIAAARFDSVVLFEVMTGRFLYRLQMPAKVECVAFNQHPLKQDKIMLGYSSYGGGGTAVLPSIQVYQIQDKGDERNDSNSWTLTKIFDQSDFEGMPTCCAWGPLDATVIAATDNGKIYQWDLEGNLVNEGKAHTEKVSALEFTKDRSVMLSVGRDSLACLWNTVDLTLIRKYQCDRPLDACSISPLFDAEDEKDRKYQMLLAGGQEASNVTTTTADMGQFDLLFVNMIYGNEVGRILAHYSPTTCVAYKPDGTGFASAAYEGNCKIFTFDSSFVESR